MAEGLKIKGYEEKMFVVPKSTQLRCNGLKEIASGKVYVCKDLSPEVFDVINLWCDARKDEPVVDGRDETFMIKENDQMKQLIGSLSKEMLFGVANVANELDCTDLTHACYYYIAENLKGKNCEEMRKYLGVTVPMTMPDYEYDIYLTEDQLKRYRELDGRSTEPETKMELEECSKGLDTMDLEDDTDVTDMYANA